MGFRDPITTAAALETGASAPGVRIYASGSNPASGVVEWHAGAGKATGTYTNSDTGSGGEVFTLQLGTFGAAMDLASVQQANGSFADVLRFHDYDQVQWNGPDWLNGGTSGVLAGTAPPAGTTLKVKTWTGSVTGNVNGDATLTFPGGAFPNGLLAVHVQAVPAATSGLPYHWLPWSPTLSTVAVRCFMNGSTTPVNGPTLVASLIAIGW